MNSRDLIPLALQLRLCSFELTGLGPGDETGFCRIEIGVHLEDVRILRIHATATLLTLC